MALSECIFLNIHKVLQKKCLHLRPLNLFSFTVAFVHVLIYVFVKIDFKNKYKINFFLTRNILYCNQINTQKHTTYMYFYFIGT